MLVKRVRVYPIHESLVFVLGFATFIAKPISRSCCCILFRYWFSGGPSREGLLCILQDQAVKFLKPLIYFTLAMVIIVVYVGPPINIFA